MASLSEANLRGMYYRQLQQLLPIGNMWTRDDDAELSKLLKGLAYEFVRVNLRGCDLLDEIDPRTTGELLSEWEAVYGLPGLCDSPSTDTERRAILTSKIVGQNSPTPALFESMATAAGFTAYAKHKGEFPAFRTGLSRVGERLRSDEWAHLWQLVLVNPDYENEERLQCLIDEVAPAHTVGKVFVPHASWSTVNVGGGNRFLATAYSKGICLVAGRNGRIYTSTDLLNWTEQTAASAYSGTFQDAVWDPVHALFVLVGNGGEIQTSPDGETWTSQATPHGTRYRSVAHDGAGKLCVVGHGGSIATSTDGVNWLAQVPATGGRFTEIGHNGAGQFVAGADGHVEYTAEGETWFAASLPPSGFASEIVWIDGQWHHVGSAAGAHFVSSDGDVWTSLSTGYAGTLYTLQSSPNFELLIGLGSGGDVLRSRDGISWFNSPGLITGSANIRSASYAALADGGFALFAVDNSSDIFISRLE